MGRHPEGTVAEGGYKSPEITHLWPHHRKMARLAAAGLQPGEIASLTGFTEAHISRILGSPAFQAILGELELRADAQAVDLREDIKKLATLALENMAEDVTMPIEDRKDRQVRQKASTDILDRAGYRKQDKPVGDLHLHKHTHVEKMTKEELRDDVMDLAKSEDKEA